MKKLMAVTLVLAMVLAFGVTSSAASLGSGWTELEAFVVSPADANAGKISVEDNGTIKLDAPKDNSWWPMAGVAFNTAVEVDGLTVVVVPNKHTDASENGYDGLFLTKAKVGDFDSSSLVRTYSPAFTAAEGIHLGLYGTSNDMNVVIAGAVDALPTLGEDGDPTLTAKSGQELTINFKVVDGKIQMLFGTKLAFELPEEQSSAIMVDGKAYLSFASVGHGSSGSEAPFEIRTINGQPANTFDGSAQAGSGSSSTEGTGSSNPDTADSLTVAVIAMMMSAAVLTAVAFRARKVK